MIPPPPPPPQTAAAPSIAIAAEAASQRPTSAGPNATRRLNTSRPTSAAVARPSSARATYGGGHETSMTHVRKAPPLTARSALQMDLRPWEEHGEKTRPLLLVQAPTHGCGANHGSNAAGGAHKNFKPSRVLSTGHAAHNACSVVGAVTIAVPPGYVRPSSASTYRNVGIAGSSMAFSRRPGTAGYANAPEGTMPPRNANVRGGSPFASAMGPGAIEESLHCVSAMPIRPSPNAVSNNASITYEVAHELAKGEQASLAPPGSPLRDGSRSASPKRPPRGSPEQVLLEVGASG